MKRRVVFSESNSGKMPNFVPSVSSSDSESEEKPKPQKSSAKRVKNEKHGSSSPNASDGRQKVQMDLLKSFRQVEHNKENSTKPKARTTLDSFFKNKNSKSSVVTATRTEVSVDDFFSGSRPKSTPTQNKTPPCSPRILVPESPVVISEDLIPDTPVSAEQKSGTKHLKTQLPVKKAKIPSPEEKPKILSPVEKLKTSSPTKKPKISSPDEKLKITSSAEKLKTPSPTKKPKVPSADENLIITSSAEKLKTPSPVKKTIAPSPANKRNVEAAELTVASPEPSKRAVDQAKHTPNSTVTTPVTPASRKPFWAYTARDGPRELGTKPIPKGNPTCLKGKIFLITGVLESIEREDAQKLIENCGGKVAKTLGKRTTHLIVGREPGESKLAKAETFGIKQLDEDDLYALIRKLAHEPLPDLEATTTTTLPDESSVSTTITSKSADFPTSLSTSPTTVKSPPSTPVKQQRPPPKETITNHGKLGGLTAKPVLGSTISNATSVAVASTKSSSSPAVHPSTKLQGHMLWVDKYRPTSRRGLVGQNGPASPTNRLYDWLSAWHQHFASGAKASAYSSAPPWATGSKDDGKWARAALLSGPPGIGKTTSASVICVELKLSTCELNASDCRSKRSLHEEVSQTLGMQNLAQMAVGGASKLSSTRHVLIMDEVDGMAGNEDRGGMQELIAMIKSSKIPIICTCNDRQSTKVRSLANYCLDLRFHRPRVEQIKAAVLSIACKEGITVPSGVLTEIIEASNQDIRQVINNTQMWCSTGSADQAQLTMDASGAKKDIRLSAFEVIRKVFSPDISGPHGRLASINDSLDLFFQDYSLVPLFVQENFLQVMPRNSNGKTGSILELMRAASDSIAMGDIVGGAIRSAGTGSWSLLPVQGIYSVVRPGRILRGSLPGGMGGGAGGGSGVSFPSWFGKNSNQGRMQRMSAELGQHLRLATHGGSSNTRSLIMDYASVLADSLTKPLKEGDTDRVINTMVHYQLQREDLDSLMELSSWSHRPNRMLGIDSKVKAAFTRSFNKSAHPVPYATSATLTATKGKGKRAPVDSGDLEDGEDADGLFVAEDEVDNEDLTMDAMIVRKKKPTRAEPKASTSSKKDSTSAGRGKSKTKSTRGRGGRS